MKALPYALLCIAFCFASLTPSFAVELPESEEVGINEKLGDFLPTDLFFFTESGDSVLLKELIDRPILLTLVYYTCPGICTPLLNEVAQVVGRTRAIPGEDFRIISISIDPTDTPELAAGKKRNYLNLIERPDFNEEDWRFLCGTPENIKRLAAAVGFRYKFDGGEFLHTGAVIVLSPDAMVSRYLYGTDFLPFDFRMAIVEAAKGNTMPTVTRLLAYCFSYDPESRSYVFALFKVFGTVMLAFIAGLILFLSFYGKRRTQ